MLLSVYPIEIGFKMSLDITQGRGFFATSRGCFRGFVIYFGIVYFLAMVGRAILCGMFIMVVFHWVLASFLICFSVYLRHHVWNY